MIRIAAAVLALAFAGAPAFADDMGKDKMGMEKHDSMGMKKDSMKKKPTKKKDAMGMEKHDAMGMEKPGMKKEGM
jgi:pentapeptide MXKDX repeat protein